MQHYRTRIIARLSPGITRRVVAFALCCVLSVTIFVATLVFRQTTQASLNQAGGLPKAAASEREESEPNSDLTVIPHDLGIIRPSQRQTFAVSIENPTNDPWTIDKISTSCGCTVAETETRTVLPQSQIPLRISYSPPSKPKDDVRTVEVTFRETGVPAVLVRISASVREPMTIDQERLDFKVSPDQGPVSKQIQVGNFSEQDWETLRVAGEPSWLSTEVFPVGVEKSAISPRQAWRIVLTCHPGKLPSVPPNGTGNLELVARSAGGELTTRIIVGAHVQPPAQSIPSQLFFGKVSTQDSATTKAYIKINSAKLIGADLKASPGTSNLADAMELVLVRESESLWMLTARLHGSFPAGYLKGVVNVHFDGQPEPSLAIPITALVEGDN